MIPELQLHHDGSPTAITEMAGAARMQYTRPEAALDRFRSLAGEAGFPYRDFAREQCAVILWRLGRRDEALRTLRTHGQPAGARSEPAPDYARARAILRMAQVAVDTGHELGSGERLAQQLERARRTFERHGDLIRDAKAHRLKAGLRSRWERGKAFRGFATQPVRSVGMSG